MEQIVHLKSHLRKQPVIGLVHRGICEVAPHVSLDGQREKGAGAGMDEEVGSASRGPTSRSFGIRRLVRMIGKEESPVTVEGLKGASRRQVLHDSVINRKGKPVLAWVKTSNHIGID